MSVPIFLKASGYVVNKILNHEIIKKLPLDYLFINRFFDYLVKFINDNSIVHVSKNDTNGTIIELFQFIYI